MRRHGPRSRALVLPLDTLQIKYASTTCIADSCIVLDDCLSAERVQLLDAIKQGDADAIRALTNIDWNFVYPPASVDAASGERNLEAWCRTPLCLLVRPDEGNFRAGMLGVSEQERIELIEDVVSATPPTANLTPSNPHLPTLSPNYHLPTLT